MTSITRNQYTGRVETVETDRFLWWSGQEGYIKDKVVGRSIYQMAYMRTEMMGSDDITDAETIEEVRAFWGIIHEAQAEPIPPKMTEAESRALDEGYDRVIDAMTLGGRTY